jgi:hypothetical protein
MDTITITAIVLGLTQVFKQFDFPKRFVPIFAIVMGILISFIATAGGVGEQALSGIVVGLMSVGLYSGGKTVITGK